ncbi:MAG: hypothetical protein ACRD5H_00250 [Nitrososphaerales archaeon]
MELNMNEKITFYFMIGMSIADIVAAALYLSQGDLPRASYWALAALMIGATLLM